MPFSRTFSTNIALMRIAAEIPRKIARLIKIMNAHHITIALLATTVITQCLGSFMAEKVSAVAEEVAVDVAATEDPQICGIPGFSFQ